MRPQKDLRPMKTITEKALVSRINRRLAPSGTTLRKALGESLRAEVGDFYELDMHLNVITVKHVVVEKWGRELGALRPTESVGD